MSRRTLLVGVASVLAATALLTLPFVGCSCTSGSTTPSSAKGDEVILDVGPDLFEDVTAKSGIRFAYGNGEEGAPKNLTILESLGGGLAVIDFDGDGLLDLFLVGGGEFGGADKKDILGRPCKLFRNKGNFQFEDVTEQVGLTTLAGGKPWFYSHGVAVADYNRDGWPDLLVSGWGRLALFRNEPDGKGGRKFVDVSAEAKLDRGVNWTTSVGWADFDGDGYPDIYACQYVDWSFANHPACTYDEKTPDVCPPKKFSGLKHLVFRNDGRGGFENVSDKCGLSEGGAGKSKGLGLVIVDVNGDGKPDVYVANDTVNNFLYVNKSTQGKIEFAEKGEPAGVAVDGFSSANGSMGTDAGDPDRKGKPWLFCTNYENELHALYQNLSGKDRTFFVYDGGSGMAALGQSFVGWGTGFVDLDHDGWEDIFIANGHAIRFPTKATRKQKPVIMRNIGDAKFRIASGRGGSYFQAEHLSRGVVLADFDNDGKVDVAVTNVNEPMAILRNVAPAGNHWLGLALLGKDHADVVGARVQIVTADGTQTRFAKGGGSYASSPDRRLVFGLGKADKVTKLTVEWPGGTRQEFADVPTDQYLVLTQDEKELKPAMPEKKK